MMELSFAWTVDALLAGRKHRTRRCWADLHASRFHKGDLVRAIDKDRRAGGQPVATIRLTADPFKQHLDLMTEEDLELEGGLWDSLDDFKDGFPCQEPYVLDFDPVSIETNAYRGALARIEWQAYRLDEVNDELATLRRRNDDLVARLASAKEPETLEEAEAIVLHLAGRFKAFGPMISQCRAAWSKYLERVYGIIGGPWNVQRDVALAAIERRLDSAHSYIVSNPPFAIDEALRVECRCCLAIAATWEDIDHTSDCEYGGILSVLTATEAEEVPGD